jgi:hypothetical protein
VLISDIFKAYPENEALKKTAKRVTELEKKKKNISLKKL